MWRSLEDAAQTAVDTEPAIKMAAKRRSSSRQWEVAPAVLASKARTDPAGRPDRRGRPAALLGNGGRAGLWARGSELPSRGYAKPNFYVASLGHSPTSAGALSTRFLSWDSGDRPL